MSMVPIRSIIVRNRHRKDLGNLGTLADSIARIGLMQPIGITKDNELVFGERRLAACRDILGLTEIEARVVDLASIVDGEFAENEIRKDFTLSERVAIKRSIEAEIGNRAGRPGKNNSVEFDGIKPGQETRDYAAKTAGLGGATTAGLAESVVNHGTPALVDAMDAGNVSVSTAADVATGRVSGQINFYTIVQKLVPAKQPPPLLLRKRVLKIVRPLAEPGS
jgi:hypothetical protein